MICYNIIQYNNNNNNNNDNNNNNNSNTISSIRIRLIRKRKIGMIIRKRRQPE